MSEETAGEKTFAPTEKRLADAAKKGDVLRSKDAGTAAVMLFGGAWLALAGPWLLEGLSQLAREAFLFDARDMNDFVIEDLFMQGLLLGVPAILTLAVPVLILTLITQLSFGRGRWVIGNLKAKGQRINPLQGLKRMFGPQGLIEMGKGILKIILLGAIAAVWWWTSMETIIGLGRGNLSAQLTAAWYSIISLVFALSAGLIVIAFVDLPIQWLRQQKRLKMSHQELRDENKQTEGSPEMRAARRQRQRDIATGSVSGAMREAQFVITNPTHFAVAMTYDPAKASAPIVLAKGRGDKALAMKELARELELPMLEIPQLARSVYYTTRERQIICEDLYGAVASVLAYVFSLKRGETPPMPAVDVPAALRFDADGRLTVNPRGGASLSER
ncbi:MULTISPECIES: flagellar biosynthesis protein FlhB [unclassified Erythrobacter]|jgi:flagellar biosynthesis protein FlhB|uniref:EscU/YscU/HrcU family type III secretion system export apparatus switch protein n=1 Tax=unclassified Erythrobacter TaxID=2633097 RepID=UPI00076C45E7|nr:MULTISPECIES: flagellar type III secretion system protein FlhB [unclassified Erythrobacter]KWV94100.1 flagellar biosynthesis protein [Erythrobacter sp. AP23]MBO6527427.1 EscU/YscU/HrcU family type III secretion system export apparatus switch protein [Erythrobacter sp.]MBO6530811.1 EscU/YscU/HrcU family type III secretion system export apparatus switch protein [Erythrobacter sp.]MBO6769467.1 EscU/YscU/HrcU family type III secretion system export apparatus switch protein [Erythrobacter sp.]